jgi:transcription initiation factor TFIIB
MKSENKEEKVDEITACPDCKSTHLKRDYDHAEIVCADCGLVLEENIVDTGPEWRAFDMQQENALARAGPPMSTTLPDKGLSTEISPTNRDYYGRSISNRNQSMLFRMRKWQRRARASKSAERNMAVAMREMQAVATNLKLPRRIQETAAFIYRRAIQEQSLSGRAIEMVAASALYAACRDTETPRTLKDIGGASNIKRKDIARCYRLLLRELNLRMPVVDPVKCISRIASKANLSEKTKRKATKILQRCSC